MLALKKQVHFFLAGDTTGFLCTPLGWAECSNMLWTSQTKYTNYSPHPPSSNPWAHGYGLTLFHSLPTDRLFPTTNTSSNEHVRSMKPHFAGHPWHH